MSKIFILLTTLLIATSNLFGQLFSDDFEAYNIGDKLACVSNDWLTWNNQPCGDEDPYIVDNGGKAVEITGTCDLVYVIPNYTSGAYQISFDIYIPEGYDGYFNTLQEYNGNASEWGMQIYFEAGGNGTLDAGITGNAATFSFSYDNWNSCALTVDLTNDWAEFFINDSLIHGWIWSITAFGGINQLGGSNFYAYSGSQSPLYYVDNYLIEEIDYPFWAFPQNVEATIQENLTDVLITWNPPTSSGMMVELSQHDGNPENAYYQEYNYGYGVVFDLSAYPDATLEMLNFHHASWGITGIWEYKLHFVDLDTYNELYVIDGLQTSGNDQWESGILLGSLPAYNGLLGVFLEPLSYDPANAYPALSADNTGPDGISVYGPISDYSNIDLSTIGDFLMDLWILTPEGKTTKANKARLSYHNNFSLLNRKGNSNTQKAISSNKIDQAENALKNPETILIGFNIFRDGELISYISNPLAASYLDEQLDPGIYEYCVSTVYDDGESIQQCDTEAVPASCCPAPTNLSLSINSNNILLSWDGVGNDWIQWDSGLNGNGIGLAGLGSFRCASHWESIDIAPFVWTSLTRVQFFAYGDPNATYTIKVWTGSEGTNEVLSQEVEAFNVDEWNTIELNNPVLLSGIEDLWFGYEVNYNPSSGTFPAGTDLGPAIPYKGDMISVNNGWESMSVEYGLDYNWNIAGYVEFVDDKFAQLNNTTETSQSFGLLTLSSDHSTNSNIMSKGILNFIGYNIYHKHFVTGTYDILATVSETEYLIDSSTLENGSHYFYVTALYDEGESEPTNTQMVILGYIGYSENNSTSFELYPNPANDIVNVSSGWEIESIQIFDIKGLIHFESICNSKLVKIDIENLKSGIYFLKIIYNKEIKIQKLIVE